MPVQKIHLDGQAGTLLVLADSTCVLCGVLVGRAADPAALAVIVVMAPTELTGGWAGTTAVRRAGPARRSNGYSVITIHGEGADIRAVTDIGAGGPATPVR